MLLVLLCTIALAVCTVMPALADTGASDAEILTVGVPTDRCPVFYKDPKTGEIAGIGIDLMRTAAEAAGYEANFVSVGEETLKDALDNDAYDVVMPFGSAIESSSGHASIVTDNLTQTPFTLVTAGGNDLPPLNDLRVGMLASLGGGAETVKQLYPGIEIKLYETMGDCVAALRTGEVDALLHNSYVWSYILQKPAYEDLTVQPSAMFAMDFRAGTLDTPEGQATVKRLNDGIATITDTRRQAIVLDYTTRRLYQYDLSDYLYKYGLLIVMGGLLFAALVVIAFQRQNALRLEKDEELRRLIDYDTLTGAYSLTGFRKRVEELLRANPDAPYLLSYHNIKNFKYINDSLGMEAGDELLRFWAKISLDHLNDGEAIGRLEGDHFAVLRRMGGEEQIKRDNLEIFIPSENFFINQGIEQRVQICSGIYVLTHEDYQNIDVDHMLDYARVAEERIRSTRKQGYEFYNPEQWETAKRVEDIAGHLPAAIKAGELQVWYQPQVDYVSGKIVGAEALCRWNHSKFGWLMPAEFIPTLEEASLIYDLDVYVWEKVCQDLHRWNEQGVHRSISVNLSRRDLMEGHDIPAHFASLLETYGLTADQLRIEVTETAYVKDPDLLIRTTAELRELGFQVEMDDFGSGYSSLHMLKEVPVDRIKLDLHFLTGTGDQDRGSIIVTHVIRLVHSLRMNLIAEGVEDELQAEFLMSRGCSIMQGFYFYRPMPVQEFEQLG